MQIAVERTSGPISGLWTAADLRSRTERVAIPAVRYSNREWFQDGRALGRRLQVTWHTDQGTAVLSIWQGDTCAATFQLPIEQTARLIAHLAEGLAATGDPSPIRQSPEPVSGLRRITAWLRRW